MATPYPKFATCRHGVFVAVWCPKCNEEEAAVPLCRRTESYNLDDVQEWLKAHPENSVTFEFCEGGYTLLDGQSRPWKLEIHGPRKLGAPSGYIAETIHKTIECLFDEDQA